MSSRKGQRSYVLEPVISRLERIIVYETAAHLYLVGYDELETSFRLLKVDRRIERPKGLDEILIEDSDVYTKSDIMDMLQMVDDGNKTTGGLTKVCEAHGLIGFVKFLDCFYINLITAKKQVGCIGTNAIYAIKSTEMIPVKPKIDADGNVFKSVWRKLNKKLNQTSQEVAESRYMALFQTVDITKDFYFSYTYDLTHSLQHNFIMSGKECFPPPPSQEIFEWNHYQTEELRSITGDMGSCYWILPIIHGSYEQRRFSIFGKTLDMILIARRSRHYAGTRYLKRGTSVHGKVANDCESEQILQLGKIKFH